MDRWTILGLLCFAQVALLGATQTPQQIYQKSVKLLLADKIKFQVHSLMRSHEYEQEQSFSIARYADKKRSTTLVCFTYPQNIKGTAILLKNDYHHSSTLVYFPSLGRSRLIPKEDEQNEAFGLGISFSEMHNDASHLANLGKVKKDGHTYYKLVKIDDEQKTLYFIDTQSMVLKEMQIYKSTERIKDIVIQKIALFHGKKIIIKWFIKDYEKDKVTYYKVDTKSITSSFNNSIFKRSAISHCRP